MPCSELQVEMKLREELGRTDSTGLVETSSQEWERNCFLQFPAQQS